MHCIGRVPEGKSAGCPTLVKCRVVMGHKCVEAAGGARGALLPKGINKHMVMVGIFWMCENTLLGVPILLMRGAQGPE
jgi:hypothetical protein